MAASESRKPAATAMADRLQIDRLGGAIEQTDNGTTSAAQAVFVLMSGPYRGAPADVSCRPTGTKSKSERQASWSVEAPTAGTRIAAPIDVLRQRSEARAILWAASEIGSIPEAVDELQAYAVASGLVAEIGQDRVQSIIAEAFRAVRDGIDTDRHHDDAGDVMSADVCEICGKDAPGLCVACREDKARRCRQPLSQSRSDKRLPTPRVVVEAILYCVRERGPTALSEPANIERLGRCDATAIAEIQRRLEKSEPADAS